MATEYFVIVDGQKVPVSEEVYRAYKRPQWSESKARKVRAEREQSLDALAESGYEAASIDALVAEIAEDNLVLEMLLAALDELTADERSLIDALYYDEKSEREYSAENGIPHQTVHSRKTAILKKLKSLLGDL